MIVNLAMREKKSVRGEGAMLSVTRRWCNVLVGEKLVLIAT